LCKRIILAEGGKYGYNVGTWVIENPISFRKYIIIFVPLSASKLG
jgi:hypothetical protein